MICTYLAHMCVFPPKEDSYVFPSLIFKEQEHIIFVRLFIQVCNTPPCYPKYYYNLWLYSTLTEAEFTGTFLSPEPAPGWENTHRSMATFFYPKCHKDKSQEGVALGIPIEACEWGKNHTCILGCLNQRNRNC